MILKPLDHETLKQAIALKVSCWQEELAGKLKHHLNTDEEYSFWLEWMQSADKYDDIRTLLGYFDGDKLVATIFASFAEASDAEHAVEINGLFVDALYRGQYLSLKMLNNVLTAYANLGKKSVIIYSHKYAPSNAFYRKFGGKVIKNLDQLDGALKVEVFHFDLNAFLSCIHKKLSELF